MQSQIERYEEAINSGNYYERVLRYRVYHIVTSSQHLKAGADWQLHSSWGYLEDAKAEAACINHKGLWLAVVVDGEDK